MLTSENEMLLVWSITLALTVHTVKVQILIVEKREIVFLSFPSGYNITPALY